MMKTLWAVSVTFCSLAVTLLALETKITVQRGRTADLSTAIAGNTPRHCSRIRYVEEPGLSCGSVQPKQFDCGYNGSVLYQHYGCYSTHEVVSFQLSILPDNFSVSDMNENVEIKFLSVEIVVEDSQSLLSNLTLHTSPYNDGVLFRVTFPQEIVGRCHYQLVTADHLLPLPLAGELRGSFPRTLPCGYTSHDPLHYVPNSESRAPRDYVLFRVSNWEEEIYVLLEVWHSSAPLLPRVPVERLVVHGSTYTPIPDGLFPFQDGELQYRYIVPAHPGGQFVLLVSSNKNISRTVFTSADLRAGLVSYHGSETPTSSTSTIHYSVTDLTGAALVQGEISLHSIPGSWSLSQRTNRGLTVVRGGTAAIDPSRLDFYQLGACVGHSTVTLVQPPHHGDFTFLNSMSITNITVALNALKNGTVVYTHSGDIALADSSVWKFFCPLGLELVLSFGIMIAPLGNTPAQWSSGHTLTTYWNLAVPLSYLPLYDPDSLHEDIVIRVAEDLAGSLVRVEDSDSVYAAQTPFPPFLDADQFNASAVFQFTLADVDNRIIWYLPPENASVDTLHLRAWESDLPPHAMNDVWVPVTIAAGPLESSVLLSTREVFPPLLRNAPLPLHSHLPVFITPRTLYSRVPGIPTSSIVYMVQAGPTHGLLCLVTPADCTSSLTQFTQSDINRQRVIYQPAENARVPDKFDFAITLRGIFHYNQSLHHFHISPVDKPRDFSSRKQFWIYTGGEKPVALKYLRPYSNLLGRRTEFMVTSHPHHGTLLLDTTPHPANFSFDDLLSRRLWYRHSEMHDSHCSDSIAFTASNGTHSLQGTLQIAIARDPGELLHAESGSQQLLGHTNFVFRPSQLPVHSPFCAQFVHYTVLTPPNRGVLQLYNTEYDTVVQLRENSTFTAQDVLVGLLHYSLTSHTPVTHNISDIFYFEVSDPRNARPILPRIVHEPKFQILILPSPDVVHRITSINISSPKPLTWLLDYNAYGYVFGPSDINIESMTLLPSEIVIVIELQPIFGTIMRNSTQVSSFSLEEVNAGWVRYETTLNRFDRISQDTFRLSIIVNLSNISYTQYVVQRHNFTVEWCSIAVQQSSYTVEEREGSVQVVLRREGPTWFQSNVTLSTVPITASPCTSPLLTNGDYCPPPQDVTFEPGERVVTVHIPITDNQVAEDTENFTLALSSPVSAVLREGHATATIWITDFSDYATIGFVGPPALTDPTTCQLEVRVGEAVGSVALNITRTGNLEESVGVICYTKAGTASRGQDFHPRPNNAPSRVEFQPNETTAQCRVEIVDDTLHEITERFLVLLGAVQGRASINTSTSPLCIYLQFDSNDMPEVSFNTSELIVQESKVTQVLAQFKIVRAGFDLSSRTTVFYTSLIRPPHDHATLHEDFELFARGECGEGVGCVDFAQGQTEVELSVRIMPDNLQEGNESFHLFISDLTNGRRGQYELLRITILDATEPTIVEFSDPVYWLPESEPLTGVNITRRGFISSVTDVTCIRKPGNATSESEITSHDHADFIAGNGPTTVTFSENQTTAFCAIWLLDDDVYEGPEDLTLRLHTNSTWVVLARARARVIITDEDDAPLVQFSPARYTVTEPLSNFPPDHTSLILHLTRSGDTSHSSVIRYSTIEDTALPGLDFVMNASRLTFLPGENTSQLMVQVLANHARDVDCTFLVVLMASDTNTSVSQEGGQARVEVRNQPVTGPYFPDVPVVVSLLEDGMYQWRNLDPILPLACITSCDDEYLGVTGVQYRAECLRQQIDPALTVYTWELSQDGSQFHQVTQGTAFTDTQVKVLEPVYLAPGLFVRCSTQAVDTYGTSGYSRTSLPSKLSQPQVMCEERSWEATMFSYPSFSGTAEDLVQLKVTLPAIPNTLPLLSTQPFTTHPLSLLTHTPSRILHLCSNLPSPTLTTPFLLHLPSPLPRGAREEKSLQLYLHLNSSSCLWHFHTWLPLHKLQADCGAAFTNSQVSVTVRVYAVLVHIHVNGTLMTSELNTTTAVLPFTPSPTPLITTFDIFSLNTNRTNAFIFPVSVSASGDKMEVYFYSMILFPGHFLPPSPNTSLLYTSTGGETQAWLARLDYSLNLSLQLYCTPDDHQSQGCAPNELYTFPLHLLHPSLVPTITTHTTLLHSINSTTEQTGPFQYGETVYGLVVVDPSYRLRANHSLTVFEVLLCRSATPPLSCTDHPSALTVLDGRGGGGVFQAWPLQLGSPDRTAFQFKPTTSLLPVGEVMLLEEYSNSSWYIHIIHGLQSEHIYPLHTLLPLPLFVPQPTSTFSPPGVDPDPLPAGSVYLYAAIAILATAILLVGMTCVVVALMLWGWRVKQKKMFLQRQRGGERNSKKEPLNSETSETSKHDPPRNLQRTHSTIGFPTVERHKRDTLYRRPHTPPSTSHHTSRSKSLPNLAFHPILDGFSEPQQRRHQHKPQTKVKMLNTEHSSLNSWSHTLQARAQGDLGTVAVRVINELAAEKKSYGVNDLGGGWRREVRGNVGGKTSALAYYAVHSLAASANTPEPGSFPATEL